MNVTTDIENWEHARLVEADDGRTVIVDDREGWVERSDGRRRWLERTINASTGHIERIYLTEQEEVRPMHRPRLSWD
jgi:hypothetical protein